MTAKKVSPFEEIVARAQLQLPLDQLYLPERQPLLEAFEDLQNRAAQLHDRDAVMLVFSDAVEKALGIFAELAAKLQTSQLNTSDYPREFVLQVLDLLATTALRDLDVRQALKGNEATVGDILTRLEESNNALREKLETGSLDVADPPDLETKNDETGTWKARWWKWSRRRQLDETMKHRAIAWSGKEATMKLCKDRIALLNDLTDLLQERFEIIKRLSNTDAINYVSGQENAANQALGEAAGRIKGYLQTCQRDWDALDRLEKSLRDADRKNFDEHDEAEKASGERLRAMRQILDKLQKELERLRAERTKEIQVMLDSLPNGPPDPRIREMEKQLEKLKKEIMEAKIAWAEAEYRRKEQLRKDVEAAEMAKRDHKLRGSIAALEQEIEKILHDIANEEATKPPRDKRLADQRAEILALLEALLEHKKRLENSLRNSDLALEYCDALDGVAHEGVVSLQIRDDDHSQEIAHRLLLTHRSIVDVYNELYVALGQTLYDKERHIEEIDAAVRTAQTQLDFCVDTFDPNAHKHVAVLAELEEMRNLAVKDCEHLKLNMETVLAEFAITAQALTAAKVRFLTPTVLLDCILTGKSLPPEADSEVNILDGFTDGLLPVTAKKKLCLERPSKGMVCLLSSPGLPTIANTPASVDDARGVLPSLTPSSNRIVDMTPSAAYAHTAAIGISCEKREREPFDPKRKINLQPPKPMAFNAALFPPRTDIDGPRHPEPFLLEHSLPEAPKLLMAKQSVGAGALVASPLPARPLTAGSRRPSNTGAKHYALSPLKVPLPVSRNYPLKPSAHVEIDI